MPLLLVLMAAAAILRPFVAESYDMAPGIQEGDLVLGIPWPTWLFGPLRRGDLVVLPPGEIRDRQIRRVLALPTEVVEIAGGQILIEGAPLPVERLHQMEYTVNGKRLRFRKRLETLRTDATRPDPASASYLGRPKPMSYEIVQQETMELPDRPGVTLLPGEYYLLADRRSGVRDSRDYGPKEGASLRRILAPVLLPGYRFLFDGLFR